jgi:hypothetical protein
VPGTVPLSSLDADFPHPVYQADRIRARRERLRASAADTHSQVL